MIGRLIGTLAAKKPPALLLDVRGVGYEVEAPMSTFYHLPALGEPVTLHIDMITREDAQKLYGFYTLEERRLFRLLIKVNGVGPKLALALLSRLSPQEFISCILQKDTTTLVRLPGVGKKTAERLLIEMGDRITHWIEETPGLSIEPQRATEHEDAIDALVALGYSTANAQRAVRQCDANLTKSEDIIRHALQNMMA